MRVEVLYFGRPRELIGTSDETVSIKDGARLADLFALLKASHGDVVASELDRLGSLIIFVNGRDYKTLGGMEAPLKDKDTVAILPFVFGG